MNDENECDRLSKELMRRFQARDREAMGRLYELHNEWVRERIGQRLRKSASRLDDVSQDVWLRVLERASSYRATEVPFLTWLLEVVVEVCRRSEREAYRERGLKDDARVLAGWVAPGPSPEETLGREASAVEAERWFDILTLPEREVFRLRSDMGLPWVEIARILGKSIRTVGRYHDSALEKLATALGVDLPEESSAQRSTDDRPEAEEEGPRDAA